MRKFFQNAGPAIRLFMVGFLFLLLQGCQHPFIAVTVDANAKVCGPGAEGDDRDDKTGPCDLTMPYSGSATGWWHQETPGNPDGHIIKAAENLSCNGAVKKKCRLPGRNCGGGRVCTNTYTSSGNCICECGET